MKKILFLLLFTIASYGQAVFDEGIQITNTESTTATKVNVQEANGKVNTQTIKTGFNKNIGLGGSDVVGANTLLNQYSTTPVDWTATASNSGQVVFYAGKQWVAKTATVAGDVPAVSPKWEEITFEALANKTTTIDQTIIDGSTNAVSGNAVFDGLALKSNIGHTHVASQITDLSKASVGLGNVDNTSDLSKPLSTATQTALNGKENSFTKNTAFNKNFGTTAGTVAEGNDSRILNGQTAFGWGNHSGLYPSLTGTGATGTWEIDISGSSSKWSGYINGFAAGNQDTSVGGIVGIRTSDNAILTYTSSAVQSFLGLGSNAYSSTPYLPLTGGTINANNETINYKVSSNNGALYNSWYDFNNNRISFLGFGGGTQSNATFFVASDNGGNIALNTTGVGKVVVSSLSGTDDGNIVASSDGTLKRGVALGSNAYNSTPYLPLSGGTLTGIVKAPTAPAGTNTTQIATTAFVRANSRPYKVYTALYSQNSTSNPTVVILENTLGTVTFTRSSNGVYLVNSSGLFTADKTFVIMGAGANAAYTNAINLVDSSTFYIVTKESSTQSSTDSANTKVAFEIRVYN